MTVSSTAGGSESPESGGTTVGSIDLFHPMIAQGRFARLLGDGDKQLNEYKSLDKMRRIGMDVTDKLVRLERHDGDAVIPRMLIALADCIELFFMKMNSIQRSDEKTKAELEKLGNTVEEHWSWLQDCVTHQSDAIFRLMEHAKLSEGMLEQVLPLKFAITVRKHLDDVRYCLALMFVVLFPSDFPQDNIISVYDSDGVGVVWSTFKSKLNKYFLKYHRYDNNELHQVYSCFWAYAEQKKRAKRAKAGVPADRGFAQTRTASEGYQNIELTQFDTIDKNLDIVNNFQSRYIGPCTRKGNLSGMTGEDNFYYWLTFFTSAFIWEYNYCKRMLGELDVEIEMWRAQIKSQRDFIHHIEQGGGLEGAPQPHTPPNTEAKIGALFSEGTGLEVRMKEKWRRFVISHRRVTVQVQTEDESRARDTAAHGVKRKANEDPDGSTSTERTRPRLEKRPPGQNVDKKPTTTSTERTRPRLEKRPPGQNVDKKPTNFAPDIKERFAILEPSTLTDEIRGPSASSSAQQGDAPGDAASAPQHDTSSSAPHERALSVSPPSTSNIHTRTKSAGKTGGQQQTYADMTIVNAKEEIARLEENVEDVQKQRRKRLEVFNVFRKGLTVLLDVNLVRLAIRGDSFLRRVTNAFAHKPIKPNEELFDAIRNVEVLIKNAGLVSKGPKDMNYEEGLQKITSLIHTSEDYFDSKDNSTEKAIDRLLVNRASLEDPDADTSDDTILLIWLDGLLPVPDKSEVTPSEAESDPLEGQAAPIEQGATLPQE